MQIRLASVHCKYFVCPGLFTGIGQYYGLIDADTYPNTAISTVKIKYPLLLTALTLSVSPSQAQELLYLKCDETRVFTSTITYNDAEPFTLKRNTEEAFVLRIDTKNEQMLVNRSEADIVIKNDEAIYSDTLDDGNVKDVKVIHTKLLPPYSRYGKGKVVFKEPFPQVTDVVIKADCTKIDPAEFDEFLNQ